MIPITKTIALRDDEVSERFILASGPGGQNVNKVAAAVQLRFDVRRSPSLPDDVRSRLERLAGRRLTAGGILVITARRYRSQDRNRQDALQRLVDLIRRAAVPPVPRKPTAPTAASRQRHKATKQRRAATKRLRERPSAED